MNDVNQHQQACSIVPKLSSKEGITITNDLARDSMQFVNVREH